jgi:polysaccharide pyruvyl transferase CsaB
MTRSGLVIAGYYGFGNAGDELILSALVREYKDKYPPQKITVLSSNPSETRRFFAVQAVNRWNMLMWLKPMLRAELFVLGGGGLLQESSGPLNHLYYLSTIAVAKILGCRTETRALGIDPAGSVFNRLLTRLVFGKSVDSISVRDRHSAEALREAGVMQPVRIEPDPVLSLKQSVLEAPSLQPARIGLAVSPGHSCRLSAANVGDIVRRLSKLAPVDLLVFFPKEDAAFAAEVRRLSGVNPEIRNWTIPDECLDWMHDYALVAGTRFHALALAAAAERSFVGWGGEQKIQALCEQFGQPLWLLKNPWNTESVLKQLMNAWEDRHNLAEKYPPHIGN